MVESTFNESNMRYMQRRPIVRRLVYVAFYELIAIAVTLLILEGALGHDAATSTLLAVLTSVLAVTWNYLWNTIFEWGERKLQLKGRSFWTRLVHAIGFEGLLIITTVPLTAVLLKISLLDSFLIQAGLLIFFFIYTYVYAWVFDKIFGLPASAK